MANYFVTKESQCSMCGGKGMVMPNIWRAYWDAVESKKISNDGEGVIAFFGEHGFGRTQIPPEEIDCRRCDGKGVIVEKVNLIDALGDLLLRMGE